MFTSVKQLSEWLAVNEKLSFTSRPRRLTRLHILLQSIASGDFNPAHCLPKFAPHSFFKGMVSHGIGIPARAEGEFLQLMQFVEPVEVIALGIEAIYRSPLRVGDVYWYEFTISKLRQRRNRWDCDCHITCKAISPGEDERVVVEEDWRPSFVEPKREVLPETRELLRIKGYRENVLRHVLQPLVCYAGRKVVIAGLCYGVLMLVWHSQLEYAGMQYRLQAELCKGQSTCYVMTGP